MADLADRIEQISALKHEVDAWEKGQIDARVFNNSLGLVIAPGADNRAGLLRFNHTLSLAQHLEKDVQDLSVLNRIYSEPFPETFQTLKKLEGQLDGQLTAHDSAQDRFVKMTDLNLAQWCGVTQNRLQDLIQRNETAAVQVGMLENWLDFVRVRDQLELLGLGGIGSAVEQGLLAPDSAETGYLAGVYDMLAREMLREEPGFGQFSGHSQEAIQQQFRDYDNKLKSLQCERIAWRIDQREVPWGIRGGKVGEYTDLSLIEHECSKKKRHIPIRQLVHRAGDALVSMKPCFMMGPMSVAQYLAPGQLEFDLVVMDEASQIKPQDALGAVARGTQLVVVGDPKQLPPTSFFDKLVSDGDDDEEVAAIEESESILDATLPMFPGRRLRWHYRSRHESLIAFSNHSFYDSDLVLFPSPYTENDEFGLKFSRVSKGTFVNQKNLEEARVIAEMVRKHFECYPKDSVGVVAMSASQRDQIEASIDGLAKEDPVFLKKLEENAVRAEPLFVKNLENVQGDERDVILISMTYGPQEPGGRVPNRFGPINADVGWRRLNVLFSRSKKRMHVFSSIGKEDIVVTPTSKRGVIALKDFLGFCESGVLANTHEFTGNQPDSDFEVAVIRALHNAGYTCVPQVGVAGFFIDVSVQDPGNPGRYLMGIECDGATYHSAKSARDRDRLRQSVLEGLGWRIRRIWSTDWFKNPDAVLTPILRELEQLATPISKEPAVAIEEPETAYGDIVADADAEESIVDSYAFSELPLREKLLQFDREVIMTANLNVPEAGRLLRPAMLEALMEYMPTSKSEFLEYIPNYLRQATDPAEGKFLEQVFEIINAALDGEGQVTATS